MTPIRIPKESERGLANLNKLDDESLQSFIAALSEVPPTFHPEKLAEKIAARISGMSRGDIDSIVSTLVSLYTALEYFDSSIPELAENVSRAMAQSGVEQLKISDESIDQFRDRLVRLLGVDAISIRSRAISLLSEEHNAYCSARVLTDIRPLFDSDLKARPKAALIVHTLRISYHQAGELKEFYAAMDAEDIEALREILHRAEGKAESLRSVLEEAGLPYLDV